jgi:predicted SAM-dependent methyltransferase
MKRIRQGMVPAGKTIEDYPARINLACGYDYRPGWINTDLYADKVDKRFDLFRPPWPFKDGAVDYVLCEQILEHIPPRLGNEDGLIVVLEELHRILRPGGLLAIGVPHAGSNPDYQDITHYRHFVHNSLDFLDPRRRPDHPLTAQSRIRFAIRRVVVSRSLHLGKYFDTRYHFTKYLAFNPNIGRKVGLNFLLEKIGPEPIETKPKGRTAARRE